VATETFFERPFAWKQRHPALYEELRAFYRQDPARLAPAGE
jgi:Mlc titration factor MtfA (ptsG expression regulator)